MPAYEKPPAWAGGSFGAGRFPRSFPQIILRILDEAGDDQDDHQADGKGGDDGYGLQVVHAALREER